MRFRWAVLPCCALLATGNASAQAAGAAAVLGMELRSLTFEGLPSLGRLQQAVVPTAVVLSRRQLQLDRLLPIRVWRYGAEDLN